MRVKETSAPRKHLEKREDDIVPLLKEVVVKGKQLSLDARQVADLLESLWKEKKNG